MRNIIIGVVIIIALGGGAYALSQRNDSDKAKSTESNSSNEVTQPAQNTAAQPATDSGNPLNITISANDNTAAPDTINATRGQTVNLTFKITNEGTYYGGMQFKSADPVIDSGVIPGGQSKTLTFTADKSFKFIPYWPQSDIKKDYVIMVNVQ
jgi:Flp pilus assembly protein TadG